KRDRPQSSVTRCSPTAAIFTGAGGSSRAISLSFFAGTVTAPAASTSAMTSVLTRSEEHTSELQSQSNLVCRLLLEKKKVCQSSYTSPLLRRPPPPTPPPHSLPTRRSSDLKAGSATIKRYTLFSNCCNLHGSWRQLTSDLTQFLCRHSNGTSSIHIRHDFCAN